MPILGSNKQVLLNQLQKQPSIQLQKLVELIKTYDDLEVADLKGYISDILMDDLVNATRDPQEVELWNRIGNAPRQTPEDIQALQALVSGYMQRYSRGPKVQEAQSLMSQLQQLMTEAIRRKQAEQEAAREQHDWSTLERGNYNALQTYKGKYPNSVHKDELDDLMWNNAKAAMTLVSLNRYRSDWPAGRHAEEAQRAIDSWGEWEEVKRSGDLFRVDDYRDNNPDTPFKNDVDSLYWKLRDDELKKMKESPEEYTKDDVERLINADIFTQWQLEDEGLVTKESWETLMETDRSLYPNIQEYQVEDPNIQAPADCTDIYLFGTPGTGKTCLLMGLTGANGQEQTDKEDGIKFNYTLNMKTQGGPYASALQEYVNAGITPGRTYGRFVTTINGKVNEIDRKGKYINHNINLVEMSGEEFALRIAESREVSLSNMGTGSTNLLGNNNRKVFFIIVDATKDKVKVNFLEEVRDAEGNIIEERVRKKYISQLTILQKFVSLFELPENQEIMKKVDAIHFVVTKADVLGDPSERLAKARDLLLKTYSAPVTQLKDYCRQSKRINITSNYNPQVFTFSLGKFYLGDVFDFDKTETLNIINTIRIVTAARKEKTWWDKLKETIG